MTHRPVSSLSVEEREIVREAQWRKQGMRSPVRGLPIGELARDLWIMASYRCALCSVPLPDPWTTPYVDRDAAVDHDHHTGHVRGVLCISCNVLLGTVGDTYGGALSALGPDHPITRYLANPPGVFAYLEHPS